VDNLWITRFTQILTTPTLRPNQPQVAYIGADKKTSKKSVGTENGLLTGMLEFAQIFLFLGVFSFV
jgi:hypothetical protein